LNEGLDTWKVKQLYLINYEFDVMNPFANVAVDISNVIDTKIKALLQHKSQVGDPAAVAKSVKTTASALGAPVGMEYAEWYTRVLMMP
jgi:LmbE family N-acetylglucosaminyl deacetylase